MSLAIGIVGLPNVGKSTLFKALTKKQVEASNFPFCTIEPNVGCVEVPDDRLARLAEVSESEKMIPTSIVFNDIAGLVKGAHQGEGLGNKFLSHIRQADAIVHVIRAFEDPNITHVSGQIDPGEDARTIELELIFADLAVVDGHLQSLRKKTKSGADKDLLKRIAMAERIKEALDNGNLASSLEYEEDEMPLLRELALLTAKPMIQVYNVSEADIGRHEDTKTRIHLCIRLESELADLPAEEVTEYLEEAGLEATGLDRLITTGYELLGLITFFTSGPKETRAWTVRNGATAPQAAGKIHSDMQRGFIRAETIHWKDFVELGESGARDKGLLRTEGKDYVVRDGDVMHFRFSA